MKNKNFKEKISLALATLLCSTPLVLTGCKLDDQTNNDTSNAADTSSDFHYGQMTYVPSGSYIILKDEDNIRILHKGKISLNFMYLGEFKHGYDIVNFQALDPTFELECGKTFTSNNIKYTAYQNTKPSETEYDHICECAEQ